MRPSFARLLPRRRRQGPVLRRGVPAAALEERDAPAQGVPPHDAEQPTGHNYVMSNNERCSDPLLASLDATSTIVNTQHDLSRGTRQKSSAFLYTRNRLSHGDQGESLVPAYTCGSVSISLSLSLSELSGAGLEGGERGGCGGRGAQVVAVQVEFESKV